jgi:two-component sensor histidine kinase
MAMIHEHLYQSERLGGLDFGQYIETLALNLFQTCCVDPSRIRLELNIEPIHLTVDQGIPCGLILNELVSNALKYAFCDGRAGTVRIGFRRLARGSVELSVADTGVGLPPGFDITSVRTLGFQVVHLLSEELNATLHITGGNGTRIAFEWSL